MFGSVINEANEPSSACRLWRIHKVETSTPPQFDKHSIGHLRPAVKRAAYTRNNHQQPFFPNGQGAGK